MDRHLLVNSYDYYYCYTKRRPLLILRAFTKLLPTPVDPAAERQKRLNDLITFKRIERKLEAKAMQLWSTKPDSERQKRVGLLPKEEDKDKRDQFIKEYINKHFDDQLSEAYGFE